jgi:hypothetical protein
MTKAEQETTIRWDLEERMVHIWSAQETVWGKLARLGVAPVRETTRHGRPSGRFYMLPLARFRWGLKRIGGHGNPGALAQARARRHPAVKAEAGPTPAQAIPG